MKKNVISKEDFLETYINKKYGIKALEICRKNKRLTLKKSSSMAFLVGYLIGDGNLSRDRMVGDFRFYGTKPNLDKIKLILKEEYNLKPYKYYLHPKGGGYILRYNNSIFSRILELYGVPRGDKILSPFKVPDWIMKSNKQTKSYFLKALLSCELENLRKRKKGFGGFVFQMSKIKKHKKELLYFLQQLRRLLEDLDIKTSNIIVPSYRKYKRKDNKISICAYFRIHTSKDNRLSLYNNVSFSDNSKQKALYNSLFSNKFDVGVPESGKNLHEKSWDILAGRSGLTKGDLVLNLSFPGKKKSCGLVPTRDI